MSAPVIENVLLLGASGLTGAAILNALLQISTFNVSIATRKDSKSAVPDQPNLKVHEIDYTSSESLDKAFAGQDAVVSALTTFAVPLQHAIVDACVRAGVKRFIPSEYGIDTSSPVSEEFIPAVAMKRNTIAYLRSKQAEKQANDLTWTAICVGAYFDTAIDSGFMGYDFEEHTAQILTFGDKGSDGGYEDRFFSATNLGRIGEAVVACLTHLDETSNQYVYVHSFRVTQKQVLAAMHSVPSQSPWSVGYVDASAMWAKGKKEASTTELNAGVAAMIRAVLMGYSGEAKLCDFEDKAVKWGRVLGLEDEDLEAVCREIIIARH